MHENAPLPQKTRERPDYGGKRQPLCSHAATLRCAWYHRSKENHQKPIKRKGKEKKNKKQRDTKLNLQTRNGAVHPAVPLTSALSQSYVAFIIYRAVAVVELILENPEIH